jgi:hypothetical protein
MDRISRNTVLVLAVAVVALVIGAQFYVGYRILTKKDVPVNFEDALSGAYEGKRVLVEGYVVKYKDANSTSYVLQGQKAIGRQVREGLLLSEGNYDPHAAYIWDGRYRTIHTTRTTIKGTITNGTIEVREAELER